MSEPSHSHPPIDRLRRHIHAHLRDLTGREDLQGVQIARLIRWIANAYENHYERSMACSDLSGPRLGLLMRLEWEARRGNMDGLTPTELSLNQRVSRNTISALLSGLESQGLIERRLDPKDRRVFRIRLTEQGRQVVKERAPRMIDHHNRLAAALTPAEQDQLIDLLVRLYAGLVERETEPQPAEKAAE